ncbi:pyrroloquinoline quinone biosynthesis protein PqqC [Kushneria phosphatilytica]|uniref:Pyrroloquinoline-quinone synthase n=1 Tax=Kushneria phosphatilytica TaxID=657387 RepID=A0A1S1NZR4_9GAMM|nr:pyrroloquinoline quinone biosynthesis protein PqqC [Kushneria phosphatilytica]QEL12727.1 pyrroloquinoline-quinone synthase PqqC [Kushneria phosphatilytica]
MTADGLEARLREIGEQRYHHRHPFQLMLQNGELDRRQVRAWALNRYYYQAMIPIKDASLMARLEDPEWRREWRTRLVDHDGEAPGEGGIERWLKLTDGLGFERELVQSTRAILPGTRFAVEAYVHFVRDRSLLEAIASSLTELFSPKVIGTRVSGMLEHYDFISEETLAYFRPRLTQAPRDAERALSYVREHARRADQQQAVMAALEFKCDVLWTMLDALHHAYIDGHVPPGAWDGESGLVAGATP